MNDLHNESESEVTFAPYATPTNVLTIITAMQNGLVSEDAVIDNRYLRDVAHIPRTMANVTKQAIQYLGLVNSYGEQTDDFRGFKGLNTEQTKERLLRLLKDRYAFVFNKLEVKSASRDDIRVLFADFEPAGQIDRMVTLFTQLAIYSGIKNSKLKRKVSPPRGPQKQKPLIQPHLLEETTGNGSGSNALPGIPPAKEREPVSPSPNAVIPNNPVEAELLDMFRVLLKRVPPSGKWPKKRNKEHWYQTFINHCDMIFGDEDDEQNQKEVIREGESQHDLVMNPIST